MSGGISEGLLFSLAGYYASLRGLTKKKPLHGGVFGQDGAFSLGSTTGTRNGLHCVHFFVVHNETECMLSLGGSKDQALGLARFVLGELHRTGSFDRLHVIRQAVLDARAEEHARYIAEQRLRNPPPPKSIPKRRREIFEASEGKCHYCATTLTLDGKWHIEHKMPRALLGGSERSNLVASCVTCNHKKRDKTDLEFLAQLAAKKQA